MLAVRELWTVPHRSWPLLWMVLPRKQVRTLLSCSKYALHFTISNVSQNSVKKFKNQTFQGIWYWGLVLLHEISHHTIGLAPSTVLKWQVWPTWPSFSIFYFFYHTSNIILYLWWITSVCTFGNDFIKICKFITFNMYFACRCSLRSKCSGSNDKTRWLPYTGVACTSIQQVIPQRVQIEKDSTTKVSSDIKLY